MKVKNNLFSTPKYTNGNISLMPKNGQKSLIAKYIKQRADIDPNGMFDVIAHGSWKEIEVNGINKVIRIDARQAAKIIKRKAKFKNAKAIRLLSCSTGARADGFAQNLANALGKTVYAPNMTIHCCENGTYWISDNGIKGEFIKFEPGGNKNEKK